MKDEKTRDEFIQQTLKNVQNLREIVRIAHEIEPLYTRRVYAPETHIYTQKEDLILRIKSSMTKSEQKLVGLTWETADEFLD